VPPSVDRAIWEAFFSGNPEPCFAYVIADAPRFTLIAVNNAWLRATGLPASVVGKAAEEFMPPQVAPLVSSRLEHCVATRQMLVMEDELRFPAGVRRWRTRLVPFMVGTQPRYLLGFAQDLTDLYAAEQALRESEAKFRHLVENASDVVFRLRLKPDVAFEYLSPAVERLTGYTPEAFYREPDLLFRVIPDTSLGAIRDTTADEQNLPNPARIAHRDGSSRWLDIRSRTIRDALGEPLAREGIARDVTEQRQRAEQRSALERRLLQTQKLESLGVLAGGIAHDFNNLLTGMLGHASLLRRELDPASLLREHADQIELAATRAADLCRQMLAYSGRGRFQVRKLDLSELVRETTALLSASISKNAALTLRLGSALPPVSADIAQLQQLVMNLVMNASESCGDESGTVVVTTELVELDSERLHKTILTPELPAGKYLCLQVSDDGVGMSAETQARIFDPFFTTKFTGRGLGLSAVLGIVRGHGGAIEIESALGRGTTFRVFLPTSSGAPDSTGVTSPTELRISATLLVVDDEEIVRRVATRLLESLGFRAFAARDGAEAVELVRRAQPAFDAILMDLTMPKLDGVAAFNEIRRLRPDVPVLLMSGYNEQEAITRFAGQGLAGFVQKPFGADQLREKLVGVLRARS
jgi:PAS domain S-box-containing protein